MDRPRSLRANFFWQFLTNGLAAVAQLAIVTALLKMTSKAVTGEFTFAWTLCTPLFMFAGLDLRSVQATDTRGEFSFVDQFAIRLLTGFLAGVVALLIVIGMGWPGSVLWVVVAVSLGKYSELVAETFVGLMQQHERFDLVTRTTAIRAAVSCLSMSGAVVATGDLVISVAVWAGCSLLVLGLVEIPLGKQFLERVPVSVPLAGNGLAVVPTSMWRTSLSKSGLSQLLKLGFPLAIRSLLVSLTPSVARFFVVAYHGLSGLGVFGPISQLTMAAILFSRTLNPAVAPRLSRYVHDGNLPAFRRLLFQLRLFYAGLGIASLLVVAFTGRWLLSVWFTPEFAQYQTVFLLAMVATATLFQGGVLDMALVTLRRVDSLAKTSVLTLGTMCVSGWLLVPMWGLEGASLAVALSWGARGIYLQSVLSKTLRDVEQKLRESATESANRVAA